MPQGTGPLADEARGRPSRPYDRVIVLQALNHARTLGMMGVGGGSGSGRVMLTRKRVIATAVGALALSAAAAGSAWAVVNPQNDYYENDHSFNENKRPYHVALDGNRLVVSFSGNISPFHNDGTGFEKLIGVTGPKGNHGLRYAVKFGRNGQARLVIHFAKKFTTEFGGRANLRYFVQTSHGVKSARLLFDIGGLCGKVSCS